MRTNLTEEGMIDGETRMYKLSLVILHEQMPSIFIFLNFLNGCFSQRSFFFLIFVFLQASLFLGEDCGWITEINPLRWDDWNWHDMQRHSKHETNLWRNLLGRVPLRGGLSSPRWRRGCPLQVCNNACLILLHFFLQIEIKRVQINSSLQYL